MNGGAKEAELGDEHDRGTAVTEQAVNGIDGPLHHARHVGIERCLAQPEQTRLQRLLVNMHAYHRVCGDCC